MFGVSVTDCIVNGFLRNPIKMSGHRVFQDLGRVDFLKRAVHAEEALGVVREAPQGLGQAAARSGSRWARRVESRLTSSASRRRRGCQRISETGKTASCTSAETTAKAAISPPAMSATADVGR